MKIRLIVPNCGLKNGKVMTIPDYGPCIADIAGGFTATQAVGGWKDDQGQLIVEPVTVFDCSCPTGTGDDWRDLAKQIARELFQTCVYLEIDGVVEYVKP
jgi:hypothetical protein